MTAPYAYSLINPNRWSPAMVKARKAWRCEHRHDGINHAACYNKAHGIEERKGFLDIEANNLNADFGTCISWAIKTIGEDEIYYDHVTADETTSGVYDGRIIETLIEAMWDYDRICTHYGNNFRFDLPFIRARYLWLKARKLYSGPPFPEYGQMWVSDTYTMAKRCLKITSRRQGNVANTILGHDEKTVIDKDQWMAISHGGPKEREKAIKYIVDHNLHDVSQGEQNYLALLPYVREVRTSI